MWKNNLLHTYIAPILLATTLVAGLSPLAHALPQQSIESGDSVEAPTPIPSPTPPSANSEQLINQPPASSTTLENSSISFHTNDEDKDADTHVTVEVRDSNNNVIASMDNNLGHFDDNSDNGPYPLKIYNSVVTKESLQKGFVTIRIDPNGHDTWRFNFALDLQLSNGSHLFGRFNGLQLTQNSRQQTFGLGGILAGQ